MKNATDTLVQSLAEWMFLYNDFMDWNRSRAKNAKVRVTESVVEKRVQKVNNSMIEDDSFDPFSDISSDDEANASDLNNTVEGMRGLSSAGIEEPHFNLLLLIKFASKVKRNQRAMCQIMNDEQLKNQAKGESALKNRPINGKSVSYIVNSDSAGKSTKVSNDTVKGDRKSENYKRLRKAFPQLRNAGDPIKNYVGGFLVQIGMLLNYHLTQVG